VAADCTLYYIVSRCQQIEMLVITGKLLACYKLLRATTGTATWEVTGKMRCELAVPGELDSVDCEPCIGSRPLLAALY